MLIDHEIRELALALEEGSAGDKDIHQLVVRLADNCRRQLPKDELPVSQGFAGFYPVDAEGYAVSFDALTQEREFTEAWQRYGFVVGKGVVSSAQCAQTILDIKQRFNHISHGLCDLERPDSWIHMPKDRAGAPILSRGFLDIYHDDMLAQLRQSARAYLHHALIWQRADLWTSFDRLGVKLPHHEESKQLPLHVDQNPLVHPGFKTVQGVLALTDCPAERGTFVAVPGSRSFFEHYGAMATNRGEYVELKQDSPIARELRSHQQVIPLRAGDFVSWDSRTTHANSENVSNDTRMVAYMAAGPARFDLPEALEARLQAFATGEGSNRREALMHASRKPRFTDLPALAEARRPERLSLLGRLLYGIERYDNIAPAPAA